MNVFSDVGEAGQHPNANVRTSVPSEASEGDKWFAAIGDLAPNPNVFLGHKLLGHVDLKQLCRSGQVDHYALNFMLHHSAMRSPQYLL